MTSFSAVCVSEKATTFVSTRPGGTSGSDHVRILDRSRLAFG